MSHKFRFTDSCLDQLKEYGQKKPPRPAKPEKPAKPETPPEETEKPERRSLFGRKKEKQQEHPASADPSTVEAAADTPEEAAGGKDMIVWTRTDIGKVRRSNQDAVIESERLVGVADGMGGHNGGEVASAGARDGLINLLKGKEPDGNTLRMAITAVNRRLYMRQREDAELSGMGTTLTVLWVAEKLIYVGHVGDSRAYRLRDGQLTQVTQDHSVVAEMVREGLLTKEQAACHPMRNVITRAVGTEDGVEVDLLIEERHEGDLWLVCSDGLYGMVSDEEMCRILTTNDESTAADMLIKAALEAGGRDNVTLTLLRDRGAVQ